MNNRKIVILRRPKQLQFDDKCVVNDRETRFKKNNAHLIRRNVGENRNVAPKPESNCRVIDKLINDLAIRVIRRVCERVVAKICQKESNECIKVSETLTKSLAVNIILKTWKSYHQRVRNPPNPSVVERHPVNILEHAPYVEESWHFQCRMLRRRREEEWFLRKVKVPRALRESPAPVSHDYDRYRYLRTSNLRNFLDTNEEVTAVQIAEEYLPSLASDQIMTIIERKIGVTRTRTNKNMNDIMTREGFGRERWISDSLLLQYSPRVPRSLKSSSNSNGVNRPHRRLAPASAAAPLAPSELNF